MVTNLKVVISDQEILTAIEKFFRAVNKKVPGAVSWERMSANKGRKSEKDAFVDAIADIKRRSTARKAS